MFRDFRLGTGLNQWRGGVANQVTLVMTEECNLGCSYCYMLHKNNRHQMTRDVAFRAIDFILNLPDPKSAMNLEFTGGEPTLEIDLMQEIVDYFKYELKKREGHPWQSGYLIQLSTNGTTYLDKKVQDFIFENHGRISPALTIDGIKEKHDMHRSFKNGKGSFDVVQESVKTWVKQFPGGVTKVTFSSPDLNLLCDSIIHLWDLGLEEVAANIVFEDVWQDGDPELFESQLCKLADAAIDQEYWRKHNTSLFWNPKDEEIEDDKNWCGTGGMVSIDCKGNLYPCVRFQGYTIANPERKERSVGNIYDGFDSNVLRSFSCLRKSLQSTSECLNCKESYMCAWCSGFNYDMADSSTIFQRMIFHCEMHRAQERANQYFWKQLETRCGVKPEDAMLGRFKSPCLL